MKLTEVADHIGKKCVLNSQGDLGICIELRTLIYDQKELTIVKITKGGEVYLSHGKKFYTVPARNIDLL